MGDEAICFYGEEKVLGSFIVPLLKGGGLWFPVEGSVDFYCVEDGGQIAKPLFLG